MSLHNLFYFITLLLSGLMAGLFFSYSCSVNPGLKTLADPEYIKAMQAINIAIQNPLFFFSFMGLVLFFPISTFLVYRQPMHGSFYWMLLAMLVYFVGVLGTTILGNVPLNEQLATLNISSSTTNEISAMREAFEKPWNFYHFIRTLASIISFGLAITSIIQSKR